MKLTKEFCDFCGHEMKASEPRAQFTVPRLGYEDRVDPAQRREPATTQSVNAMREFDLFTMRMFGGGGPPAATAYDVCLGCARSFLAARIAATERGNGSMVKAAAGLKGRLTDQSLGALIKGA